MRTRQRELPTRAEAAAALSASVAARGPRAEPTRRIVWLVVRGGMPRLSLRKPRGASADRHYISSGVKAGDTLHIARVRVKRHKGFDAAPVYYTDWDVGATPPAAECAGEDRWAQHVARSTAVVTVDPVTH